VNSKIITAFGAALTGLLIFAIYIMKRIVPLTDVYLGGERITHVKVVFIFGIVGIVIIYLLRRFLIQNWIKYPGRGISFLFIVVLPVLFFISQSGSFRGFKWAVETLIIGMIPISFIYSSYLVLINNKIENLILAIVYIAFSLYHIVLFIKVLPGIGKAFSRIGTSNIPILLGLIVYGLFFAFFSVRSFKSREKE